MSFTPNSPGAPDAPAQGERDRVRRVYEAYESDPYYAKIWGPGEETRFRIARKWSEIERLLRREGIELERSRVLDLGAGGGWDSARFVALGVPYANIVALDLIGQYALLTRRAHPRMKAVVADATLLPFPDGSFDLVYQSTMLSSVLDAGRRTAILGEARRVLAPGGLFLSYDVRYPNPCNPNTRPLRARHLRLAFAGWRLRIKSVTALPPLARLLAPASLLACRLVEAVPALRSHLLAVARKPPDTL
jgi:SAM-dependent methyltransferase